MSSGQVEGSVICRSACGISLSLTANILPSLALISCKDHIFFSNNSSSGKNNTVGKSLSIKANGPCLSSPAG